LGFFKKVLIIDLGLIVGIFNPLLGIGLIVLYFFLQGEEISKFFIPTSFRIHR